ncbi:patatin-like phospholipase family protein [Amycolatopsis suaedae]|uniref:Patatin-like phospholipase family protein n=1 Tax=Amycolatopsis suaedae TaxID=2510978 RepID=A0A4Q7JCB5_9PSEU|nr:patatin-like phospholipase family protein [Amycolatopsis suaedae]RZQ64959.1 patatin-like phospholipase family protein [Amycolatopsis suaedae]
MTARGEVGLCLSGGGYRAMLFHAGSLLRLNELGWLPRLRVISSVSGGSIVAGVLAKAWNDLDFVDGVATDLTRRVVDPVRSLASRNLDIWVPLRGMLRPGRSVGEELARSLRRHLLGDFLVNQLPSTPEFVFNATNLCNGETWWFYKDKEAATAEGPPIGLATAVAASSAFPPILSPILVPTSAAEQANGMPEKAVLSDAGVYDNLGLDPVLRYCDTVLASDAGLRLKTVDKVARDWPRHLYRVLGTIDNQVRTLRRLSLVKSYVDGKLAGAYWSCHSELDDYGVEDALPAPVEHSSALAVTPTRLHRMKPVLQERLINWGYAVTDAAMRAHVVPEAKAPSDFPYPGAALG